MFSQHWILENEIRYCQVKTRVLDNLFEELQFCSKLFIFVPSDTRFLLKFKKGHFCMSFFKNKSSSLVISITQICVS